MTGIQQVDGSHKKTPLIYKLETNYYPRFHSVSGICRQLPSLNAGNGTGYREALLLFSDPAYGCTSISCNAGNAFSRWLSLSAASVTCTLSDHCLCLLSMQSQYKSINRICKNKGFVNFFSVSCSVFPFLSYFPILYSASISRRPEKSFPSTTR